DASTADYGAYLAAIAAELFDLADDQWSPAPGTLDAVVASLTVQRPGPALTPEKLANTSYKSTLAPAGEVRLVDGSYEDGENRISVTLAPEPMASGELDGFEAAAVLIVENGGGSGSFVSLAVVLDVGGDAINIASTTLGDRVSVSNLAITDEGRIVVDMVQQGPNDPMCCPTLPTTQVYVLAGDQLVMEEETTAAIAATGESGPVSAAVIEPVAYDTSMPPGAQGQPRHFVFAFDGDNPDQAQQLGNGYVAVYPVEEYKQIWAEADDPFVADTLAQIETLLTDRPAAPQPALPVLPPVPAANDLAAQVAYLDLPDGAGVRFVGRFVQDLSPVENAQLRYLFQGLTRDGQYLITASIPVTTSLLPAEPQSLSGAEYERFVQDYIGYLEETTATLDAAAPGDFVPDLDVLDALLESVDVTVARNPLSPRSLANMEYKSEMAEAGGALLQNGIYTETVLPGSASIITVQLVPFPLAYGRLDGEEAAAVLLAENGGGSGTFVNLAVVVNRDGVPVHVASAPLGDRVQVSSLTLEDDLIRVEMLAHGPDDPACCPNQPVTQRYRWQDTQLVLDDGAHDETADGSPLAGTAWQWLLTINSDEAVTVPAVTGQYTLVFHGDGTLRATSDCADLSGSYSTGEDAALAIDLKTSTAASCAAGSQHLDYVFDLMAAASYEMAEGKLFVLKEYGGIMEFAPAP
ncbi:MAG: META domain-containing protein, partial [Caldilineaceae bacterium]|nr:META domain-containing protein [Caldilineaceae bacterium]